MSINVETDWPLIQQQRGYFSKFPVNAPLYDTGGQVYNVKSFGAKVDGVTDDTVAFKGAYTAATAAGGTVGIPAGTIILSPSITLQSNTTIAGAGRNATIIKCSSGASAAIFTSTMSVSSFLHDFVMRDLTLDGASGAATRGVQIDSSVSTAVPFYNIFFHNVNFQNFYIGLYHGANNNNGGPTSNYMSTDYCYFSANSFGYVMNGIYVDMLDHCFFANNTQCGIMTVGVPFGPSITGSQPGAGPATSVVLSNIEVQNSIADFTNGTDHGILVESSFSIFDNVTVSNCSLLGIETKAAEPGLNNNLTNINVYGCGGGVMLNSTNSTTGGQLSQFSIVSCGQKSNWSGGFPNRQSPLDLLQGRWNISNGSINNGVIAPTFTPPYGFTIGAGTNNNMTNVNFSEVDIQGTFTTANYHIYNTQNNLVLTFNKCPTITDTLIPSTTSNASLNIPSGTAPTSPASGDVWFDGSNLKFRNGSNSTTFVDDTRNQSIAGIKTLTGGQLILGNGSNASKVTAANGSVDMLNYDNVGNLTASSFGGRDIFLSPGTGGVRVTQNGVNAVNFVNGSGAVANTLVTSGGQVGIGTASPSDALTVVGNVSMNTAGNKLKIATGSNASAGTGTLSGGTVVISTTAVTANSLIFLTDTTNSLTNLGTLTVSAISAGASFTVKSSNTLDTSTFNWLIIN